MFKKFSEGVYGEIFTNSKTVQKRLKKNNKGLEYSIQSLAYKIDPKHVARPIEYDPVNMTIQMNYVRGVPLVEYRGNRPLNEILLDIVKTIKKIQKKYPSFRHNDLHGENILVKKNGIPVIIDFGLANIEKKHLRNKLLRKNNYLKKEYGIFPRNDNMYDVHYVINSLYIKGKKSVAKYLPKGYTGTFNDNLSFGRFRYDVSHESFPGFEKIISQLSNK